MTHEALPVALVGASDGARVRFGRLARSWSQDELADKVGISRSRIQQIERSDKRLPQHLRSQFATVLDLDFTDSTDAVSELVTLVNDPHCSKATAEDLVALLRAISGSAQDLRTNIFHALVADMWEMTLKLAKAGPAGTMVIPDKSIVDCWAILLSKACESVKAVNSGPIRAWWHSEPGRRYQSANLAAADRGVPVKRVFILDGTDELKDPAVLRILEKQVRAPNIDVRFLATREAGPNPPAFVLVDDQIMASQSFGPEGISDFSIISDDEYRLEVAQKNFDLLFDESNQLGNFDPALTSLNARLDSLAAAIRQSLGSD